jgi:small subunit ribosomal protein S1
MSSDEKPGDEKLATEDFGDVLHSFTADDEEAASDDHVLKGTVLKLTSTHVVVDVGAKSEGMLPLAEILDHEGKPRFKPGDEIDVMRDKGPSEEGYINLSFLKAQRLRAWDDIEKAYTENKPIHAVVVERTKGGVTVDINGARAFLPGSQIDLRPVHNLDGMKGQSFDVAIVKLNKKRGNIVVSASSFWKRIKTRQTLEHLPEGADPHRRG